MAKWNVQVVLTGYVEVEVEATDYSEACKKASLLVNEDMVHDWYCEIEECEKEDD